MSSGATAVARVATSATVLLLAATACTSTGDNQPSPTSSGGRPSGTSTGSVTTGSVTPGPSNDIEKRKSVVKKSCGATQTGAKATGVIVNSTAADAEFKITVTFTNDKATNVGSGETTVTAPAGTQTPWTVRGEFTPIKKVLCVVVAVS